jgi:electron transfer flavoprotein alpha subunit
MLLTLLEHNQGKLNAVSLETLTLAHNLAADLSDSLEALVVGEEASTLVDQLSAYGVTKMHLIQDDGLKDYAPEAIAHSIVQVMDTLSPEAVFASGTDRGNEILAHVAAITDLSMAANCVEVQPGESYQVIRVRWGGSLLEEAKLTDSPKLLTIAPNMIESSPAVDSATCELAIFKPTLDEKMFRVRVTERIEKASDKVSLAEARVVIGGGRGVGSAEGFALLDELADLLGGAVGGSRVATNLGWRPHSDQIGQTGTRIAPDLYIACGISGAIQHMVGCKGAKHILVINEDSEAPILERADYAVLGDLHEIVPALIDGLKKEEAG